MFSSIRYARRSLFPHRGREGEIELPEVLEASNKHPPAEFLTQSMGKVADEPATVSCVGGSVLFPLDN